MSIIDTFTDDDLILLASGLRKMRGAIGPLLQGLLTFDELGAQAKLDAQDSHRGAHYATVWPPQDNATEGNHETHPVTAGR